MKTEPEIERELEKIECDVRLQYDAARIETNTPLALIQLSLKTKADALRWVLGLPRREYHGKD